MSLLRRLINSSLQSVKYFSSLNLNQKTLSVVLTKPIESSTQTLINYDQTRDYKVKTRLRKRCKSCFFVWRNGRLYVECKEHPRHKQHHIDSLVKGYDNIPHGYHIPKV
ncbi:unnamed protein product [Brachionus calyciflorus]|uniref:Ribosomal protein n=1 Tax=Brachionus calyciflorus TaxID=104777 RepID=A0A813X567_9BILA|nr:unnamed protein product [Brachionus calyciflorus]